MNLCYCPPFPLLPEILKTFLAFALSDMLHKAYKLVRTVPPLNSTPPPNFIILFATPGYTYESKCNKVPIQKHLQIKHEHKQTKLNLMTLKRGLKALHAIQSANASGLLCSIYTSSNCFDLYSVCVPILLLCNLYSIVYS